MNPLFWEGSMLGSDWKWKIENQGKICLPLVSLGGSLCTSAPIWTLLLY